MTIRSKKRSSRLSEKLKNAVQNLHVDVFGIEEKVAKNINSYFSKLSQETGLSKDMLVVRIFKDAPNINVAVYNNGKPVKKITISELILLFMNSEPNGLFDFEDKVIQGIDAFMIEFSTRQAIDVTQLHICILANNDRVWIKGYNGIEFLTDIPLKELIKHFTQ